MDIIRRHIAQYELVDLSGLLDINRHAGRRDDDVELRAQTRLRLTNLLLCLKEPRTAGNAQRFERGGDRQTDRLVAARFVRHQQERLERIEAAMDTFHRGSSQRIWGFKSLAAC